MPNSTQGNIHIWSTRSVRLAMHCAEGKELATATGFFVAHKCRLFVVTNWHVTAGLSPITNMPLWDNKPPTQITVYAHLVMEMNGQTIHQTAIEFDCSLQNLDMDEGLGSYERRKWFEHPTLGKDVDIAAFEVTEEAAMHHLVPSQESSIRSEDLVDIAELSVMDELFIIGYPKIDRTVSGDFPIYKSATIASEPRIPTSRPCFYVDSKTKSGMSGSLVIKEKPMAVSLDGSVLSFNTRATEPIGIYSGRDFQSNDGLEAELGIVWPIGLVADLISAI